jgi:hypothetical protein
VWKGNGRLTRLKEGIKKSAKTAESLWKGAKAAVFDPFAVIALCDEATSNHVN